MGKVLSKLLTKMSADGPKRILMLGLDNAGMLLVVGMCFTNLMNILMYTTGKTTILYRMKRTEDFSTVPTIGTSSSIVDVCDHVENTFVFRLLHVHQVSMLKQYRLVVAFP
jgi:hypothetical protein